MDDAAWGAVWFALIVLALVLAFRIDRARHPKTGCRPCHGSGRRYSSWSRRWRDCPPCGGRGVRG